MSLRGEFTSPGDRIISHNVILSSILANGECLIDGLSGAGNIKSCLALLKSLGGKMNFTASKLHVKGLGGQLELDPEKIIELNCGKSGSCLGLASGIVSALPGHFVLDGDSQLRRRPMERLVSPLRRMGAKVSTNDGKAPLTIEGAPLHGLEYTNSDSSGQIKSALIFATMSASSPSIITESLAARDHTERLLKLLGAKIKMDGDRVEINPGPLNFPPEISIPGDPSAAAFFLIGAAMIPDSSVTAHNVLLSSQRIAYLKVLDRMGAGVSVSMEQDIPEPRGQIKVEYTGPLKAVEVDDDEIPVLLDEIPMLALAAATANGLSVFKQVRELRQKESDRLTGIKHQLGALGVRVKVDKDNLFIEGPTKPIIPECLDSGQDPHMAMMLHMAKYLFNGENIKILADESIAAFYPGFKNDLDFLSGKKDYKTAN